MYHATIFMVLHVLATISMMLALREDSAPYFPSLPPSEKVMEISNLPTLSQLVRNSIPSTPTSTSQISATKFSSSTSSSSTPQLQKFKSLYDICVHSHQIPPLAFQITKHPLPKCLLTFLSSLSEPTSSLMLPKIVTRLVL